MQIQSAATPEQIAEKLVRVRPFGSTRWIVTVAGCTSQEYEDERYAIDWCSRVRRAVAEAIAAMLQG